MSIDPQTIQEGAPVESEPIVPGLPMVARYCGLAWAYMPFFFDAEAAKANGLPGTIVPGPLKLGLLHQFVAGWVGDAGFVRHVRVTHRRPDPTGRPLTVRGQVARVFDDEATGARCAELELALVTEEGDPSVRGIATVQFTS